MDTNAIVQLKVMAYNTANWKGKIEKGYCRENTNISQGFDNQKSDIKVINRLAKPAVEYGVEIIVWESFKQKILNTKGQKDALLECYEILYIKFMKYYAEIS